MKTESSLNADTHSNTCWLRLVAHAQAGRCSCHLSFGGAVHVLNGCATGRMLNDEYQRAKEAVKARARAKLEAGDFVTEADPVFQGRDGVMYDL